MKVYIAAPFQLRDEAIAVMRQLKAKGHVVTSRWLVDVEDPLDLTMQGKYARKCMVDVEMADVFLALNPIEWANAGTGGRHVELGMALVMEKAIVLLGKRSNVFHHLERVRIIDRLEDL